MRTNSPHVRVAVDNARVMGERVDMNREGLMAVVDGRPRAEAEPIRYQSLRKPDARMVLPVLPLKPPKVIVDRDRLMTWHAHETADGLITCRSSPTHPCEVWQPAQTRWVNVDKKPKKRRKR